MKGRNGIDVRCGRGRRFVGSRRAGALGRRKMFVLTPRRLDCGLLMLSGPREQVFQRPDGHQMVHLAEHTHHQIGCQQHDVSALSDHRIHRTRACFTLGTGAQRCKGNGQSGVRDVRWLISHMCVLTRTD